MASPEEPVTAQAAPINTLGLELEQTTSQTQPAEDPLPDKDETASTPTASESKDTGKEKEKKTKEKPYHNPDRVLTGGTQRVRILYSL